MSDWTRLDAELPPYNTPLWMLADDRSMLQGVRLGDKIVSPKVGYVYPMSKFTHWTIVPELPDD